MVLAGNTDVAGHVGGGRLDGKKRQRGIAQPAPDTSEEGPLCLIPIYCAVSKGPAALWEFFFGGSALSPS